MISLLQYKFLVLVAFSLLVIIVYFSLFTFTTTTTTFAISDTNNEKNDKFKLTIEIDLNNIRAENPQFIKLVAFINGEIQTRTIDIKNDVKSPKISIKTPPFEFNKSNDVSKIDAGDEYFVCGYILKQDPKFEANKTTLNNKTMLYDCNEGRLASPDNGSPTIFKALNKYDTSVSMYQSAVNAGVQDSKEIKVILTNPINVIEHLDNAIFVAMVKGDYQIKKINIKDEIEKSKSKDVLKVPFTFNRNTEIGPIQIGDFFFGCITAGGYSSSENSECENRNIKHFDKSNDLPVAH
jgi:hypothetical protein